MKSFRLLFLASVAAIAALPAHAHILQVTGITVRIENGATTVSVVAHVPMFKGADPTADIPRRLKLRLDNRPFRPGEVTLRRDPLYDTITWETRENIAAGSVAVDAPLFPDQPDDTTVVLVYRNGEMIDHTALNPSHPAAIVGENVTAVLRRFVEMGIRHILTGPDHILFVLGLIMIVGPLRRLLGVVTAFTLAHSLTLSLTALGLTSLSPRLVEPMIALSIVAVGIENLLRPNGGLEMRAWLAFGFGFFHGFGFAGALADVGLPRQALGWSLASFNFGVEIGQAGIVLLVAPLLAALNRHNPVARMWFTRIASVAIAIAGAIWFVARIRA